MASIPKGTPEPQQGGKPLDPASPDNREPAAVLTPPPMDQSSSAVEPSDAPTLIDQPFDAPTLVDPPALTPTRADAPTAIDAGPRRIPGPVSDFSLVPGAVLGQRYEILSILGEGGMGAVYKAMDRELNRPVALKVIRPELAKNKGIIARFKQELLLARQVTHRNVIRIYDLGEADGVKFITMEFIEGEDLRTLMLREKKLSPTEAIEIIQQVCRALEAAHSVGVIHRDLKPQNIMRDKAGRILVMDFGLARTMASDGMTKTGALVGTMDYMSPEQALGKTLDQRSDLYTVGLILYELLTGKMPFAADSAIASLLKRTQERAVPISDHDDSVPRSVSNIVGKCLERDVSLRYQNVAELLADLEAWQGNRAGATLSFHAKVGPWGQSLPWPAITAIAMVIALSASAWLLRGRLFGPVSRPHVSVRPQVSLAILPFRNGSGDPTLDWLGPSLAEMLSTDVGQSAQLRTVPPTSLHQIFTDLRISPVTVLDPAMIRRVADFSSADRVIWGTYAKFGDQIRIDATLQDIKNDRSIPLKIDVPSEKEIPGAVDQLAESIRQKLALPEDVLKELKASSFQPNSSSVNALRDYNQGIGFQRDGKNLEAQKQFEAATKADPNFALAFSKLAQTYSSLGYDGEAEQSAQRAVTLSQDLPEAEKYLISAIRSQVTKNYPEAIKAYETLAKVSPGNSDVQAALADLYEQTGDFAKATEHNQKILAASPNDIAATLALGRLALNSGKPQASLDPLNRALTLSVQRDNAEQQAAALQYLGTAYRMLNKPEEALRNYQEALAIRRQLGQKAGIASSLNGMARIQAAMGKNKDALAGFQEALQIRRDIDDKRGLGDTLVDMGNLLDDLGDHDQALKMYKEALQAERDVSNEQMQATCLNNIGAVYFEKGQYEDARTYYQQALELREKSKVPGVIVESIQNLAYVSVRMGEYDQAVTQYMRSLELHRNMEDVRGAALDSYSLGVMFDYQGRFGAAVNSKQAALKSLQDLKDKSATMTEIESGYAKSLILAGRSEEAMASLDDALSLAREQKNDGLVSQTLGFQGDAAYYRGDSKSARTLYEQALQAAVRSKEPDKILTAKVNVAKASLQEGHGLQAIPNLRELMQQADEQGVQNMSVECALYMAEAMLQSHDNAHAQQELGRALLRADKIGLKPLSAKANYLLGIALRDSGDQADAQQHYRTTVQLLDDMRKEPGAEKIMQRSDFKAMYDEATRESQKATR
ncbi:MAG TPA: tetratricopeptide repeat protein [Terriglobales bacterium]|nr:tetratricopeptide repeat protein [Terriglobales bacterium]